MPILTDPIVNRYLNQNQNIAYTLDSFWNFTDGAWQPVSSDTVRAQLIELYAQLGLPLPGRASLASIQDELSHRLVRPLADWNQDPGFLPVRNGLLQLATGDLLQHYPFSFQARTLAAAYDPAATAPVWQSFLLSTVPAAADFLQEFAGLALTFDSRHELAVWLYGPPGSGKSTFLVGLQAMLGPRAGQLDLLTLGRRRFDPASLFGRSLLLSAEQPLADLEHDNLLNALISGEPLLRLPSAGRQPESFTLRAKWIWAMVALPRLNRSTSGLYRRVRLVPFPPRPEAERDPALKSRLALEGSGILNWALAGLARLTQRGRFSPPPAVALASDQFHDANDLAAQFVAEACLLDPAAREPANLLYKHYVAFCRRSAARPESTVAVAAAWENLGLQRTRSNGHSFWTGLRLRPNLQLSENPDYPATPATPATGESPDP